MKDSSLKPYLDELVDRYNRPSFIVHDPISIPHRFTDRRDIEISGFLSALIAWGQRKTIVSNAEKLMEIMDNAPYSFVMSASQKELDEIAFVHRTFNSIDLEFIIKGLRSIYQIDNSLEHSFIAHAEEVDLFPAISRFRTKLIGNRDAGRTAKHIANPEKNTAAKRIHMFLRWMIRNDDRGVDFGIWKSISPSVLSCPLDVHTGNNARALGLLSRKQNDRKAVEELNKALRQLDSEDPVRYDFALFGMGVDPAMKMN